MSDGIGDVCLGYGGSLAAAVLGWRTWTTSLASRYLGNFHLSDRYVVFLVLVLHGLCEIG